MRGLCKFVRRKTSTEDLSRPSIHHSYHPIIGILSRQQNVFSSTFHLPAQSKSTVVSFVLRAPLSQEMDSYVDIGFIPPEETFDDSVAMAGDEYVRCNRCGFGGCDIRVSTCGCTLHAVRRFCTVAYVQKFRKFGRSQLDRLFCVGGR